MSANSEAAKSPPPTKVNALERLVAHFFARGNLEERLYVVIRGALRPDRLADPHAHHAGGRHRKRLYRVEIGWRNRAQGGGVETESVVRISNRVTSGQVDRLLQSLLTNRTSKMTSQSSISKLDEGSFVASELRNCCGLHL